MSVAERVAGDTADQVDVLLAVGVPHFRALAADERQLGRAVVVHQGGLPVLPSIHIGLEVGHGSSVSGKTMVPTPREVKTSSSTEWARRPSITCARRTPPRMARTHASIFGIMPLARVGSMVSSRSTRTRSTSDDRSGQFA